MVQTYRAVTQHLSDFRAASGDTGKCTVLLYQGHRWSLPLGTSQGHGQNYHGSHEAFQSISTEGEL